MFQRPDSEAWNVLTVNGNQEWRHGQRSLATEISSPSSKNAYHQENKLQQMLTRRWGKRNSCSLLGGMWYGIAFMEISVQGPQKFKSINIWLRDSIPGQVPKGIWVNIPQNHVCTHLLLLYSQKSRCWRNQSWPLLAGDLIMKIWCIYTMECYSAIKKSETISLVRNE